MSAAVSQGKLLAVSSHEDVKVGNELKLVLNGFEPASIARLPTKYAQIHMRLVHRESLDRGEQDRQIE